MKQGKILAAVHDFVRTKIEHLEQDQIMYDMMETSINMVKEDEIVKVAEKAAKENNISFL